MSTNFNYIVLLRKSKGKQIMLWEPSYAYNEVSAHSDYFPGKAGVAYTKRVATDLSKIALIDTSFDGKSSNQLTCQIF